MIIGSFDDFLYHTYSLFKGTLRGKIIIVKNNNFKHSHFKMKVTSKIKSTCSLTKRD